VFPGAGGGGARAWLRALRPHQWLKNLLVFVPLLTAFLVNDPGAVLAALLAFVAFGCVASGGYLVNDLLDLSADRRHPTKHLRPFASGELKAASGVAAAAALFAAGLGIAALVAPALAAWLAAYGLLTLAYSLFIKRQAVFDLIALAALYTIRILAGGAAVGVEVSFWLLAFSVFLFFSLATVKRCAELVSMRAREVNRARGRGYEAGDYEVLKSLGTSTSVAAVLVLALYVESAEIAHRYAAPRLLWLMLVGLLAWLSHLWLVTARGAMDDDPLVFTLRDPVSRWLVAAIGLAFACAALLRLE
jgi:4-hydroxybenzoate polyprenyltransferase